MNRLQFCALAVLCSPVWAVAQTAPQRPSIVVEDPTAPVPAVVYQSVFADTPTGVEQDTVAWKRANADVGQFKRGHVDILRWEQSQTGAPTMPATHHQPRKP